MRALHGGNGRSRLSNSQHGRRQYTHATSPIFHTTAPCGHQGPETSGTHASLSVGRSQCRHVVCFTSKSHRAFEGRSSSVAIAVDSLGTTALMHAAQHGRSDVAWMLLRQGATLSRCDRGGHTALHWAAACSRLSVARLLLREQADPNMRDVDGLTPLDRAARAGSVHLMLLLEHAHGRPALGDLASVAAERNKWHAWLFLRMRRGILRRVAESLFERQPPWAPLFFFVECRQQF